MVTRSVSFAVFYDVRIWRGITPCVGTTMSHRPRKRGNAPWVSTASASQARQRSMGANRIGLASESALHGVPTNHFSPLVLLISSLRGNRARRVASI